MIYCFDLDGTLATDMHSEYGSGRYMDAQPLEQRIAKVNALYDAGHTIKIFTARGITTGWDWRELTEHQLREWGVKYHELIMGKPHADWFIDDRAVNIRDFMESEQLQ